MINKRGIFFSSDAIIALIIIFLSLLIIYPTIQKDYESNFLQEDFIVVLSSLKIGEIQDPYFQDLISDGKITQLNKTILEQIGEFYVTNITLAKEMANNSISFLDTGENIGIWYGNNLLASKNSTPFENAENVEVERQIISGLKEGESVTGYSARAFLTNPYPTKYFYFGGYIGDGNITKEMDYTGQLDSVNIEIAINKDFDIYINNNFSGHYQNSSDVFTPADYDLSAYINNFHSGKNTIEFRGNNLYISGGFIKIIYNNSTLENIQDSKHFFDGIDGLINIYDSIYAPENLNSLDIFLHLNSSYKVFLVIGNTTVFNQTTNGEQQFDITNSYISGLINYNNLESKTTPIRLGMENVSYATQQKPIDTFSVNDISGSMAAGCIGGSSFCCLSNHNCNTQPRCNSCGGTWEDKIGASKNATKVFIDAILNNSNNRVGLSAYSDTASNSDFHNLSNNNVSLKNEVNSWVASGSTCICCGINKALSTLNASSNSSKSRSIVVMSDGEANVKCSQQGTGNAKQDAIKSACTAYNNYSIRVYSIGFGSDSDNATMQSIANCGNGTYNFGNVSNIIQVYQNISADIIQASYKEQTISSNGSVKTKLFPDSYILLNYSSTQPPYGLITSAEKKFTDSYNGNFELPDNSSIIKTDIVSYSGSRWTNYVSINNFSVYNLSSYGSDYIKLGDPYSISIPNNLVNKTNKVYVTTGVSLVNYSSGSISNKIIYSIVRDMNSFSPVVSFAEGCNWIIDFEDNTNISVNIPLNYSGINNCHYQDNLESYSSNDALQVAVYNLLKLLDFNSNGKVDVKFNEQNLDVGSTQITGIPYEWSTEVQVRKWK